jgi:hypothetical protein
LNTKIELGPRALTEEEEAAALAQAEYEDDMGIERDPETYTILRVGAAGRRMTRSATTSGEPIGAVFIHSGLARMPGNSREMIMRPSGASQFALRSPFHLAVSASGCRK